MTNSLILAVNMKSASEYAQLAGLQKHTWRWASSADSIVGSRPTDIYELPCFARRGNRFGISVQVRTIIRQNAAEYVQVTEDELDALRVAAKPTAPEHSDKTVGEQLDIWDALEEPRPEPAVAATVPKPGQKPKPAKKATAKKPDALPKVAEALAVPSAELKQNVPPPSDFFGV